MRYYDFYPKHRRSSADGMGVLALLYGLLVYGAIGYGLYHLFLSLTS